MLVTGDGAGIVAMLAAADDVGSQLAGEALLLSLAIEVSGAASIAERCAAALRVRGWEGDPELALQLDIARGAAIPTDMSEIPADLEMLADVLHGGLDAAGGRLDLTSGQVWPETMLTEAWLDDEDEDEDEDELDDERWLFVEPIGSRPAYRDMTDFIATRGNPDLSARLEIAVDGRGAFGRFRHVIDDWPQDREDWIEFSEERRQGRARAWLVGKGYRPAVQQDAPPIDHRWQTPRTQHVGGVTVRFLVPVRSQVGLKRARRVES